MGNRKDGEVAYELENAARQEASGTDGDENGRENCRIHQALLDSEDARMSEKMCRCPVFCPVDNAMDIFSGKWTVKTLYTLFVFGRMRFGQLQKSIEGISKPMLSSTLKLLEERGLVVREQYNEVPPHVEYSLTEGGEAMKSVFVEIARWSSKYLK
ncbi:MAG: helix-turn-helix transcriptional regulator [Lachnospiraceae bacterium]|nr:helix-turn-helix transcriptional regulator [Lachnospiraceae bacterium]